ncbi:hypothetical protein [Rhodanobacter ginsengiterrae]|uniref:hypothetical protein n=1 Tax=Rhodanobacter ginsengiterrae TaxID=2008451 RepID=UPI003CEB41B5
MTAAIGKKAGALLLGYFLLSGTPAQEAVKVRPISSTYGICLRGMDDFSIRLDSPVDVEFASLVYKRQVVGQFELTILGPDHQIPANEVEHWRHDEVILVRKKNGYIAVKRNGSSAAYPNVYVSLSLGTDLPRSVSAASVMHALVACKFKAPASFQSPPKINSMVDVRS